MRSLHELAIDIANPEICASCPRRSLVGKVMAKACLGSEYIASGCNPAEIVQDGELRNHLFEQGVVTRPHGINIASDPSPVDSSHRPAIPIMWAFPHPRATGPSIRFGFSDQVCPQDVPLEYTGNFTEFTESIKNQRRTLGPQS